MTAPPLVPESTTEANAGRARTFNEWVVNQYAAGYSEKTGFDNLRVFDLFSLLTDDSGHLKAEYRKPTPGDSHPNAGANEFVAQKFMEQFRLWLQQWEDRMATPSS